MKQPTKPMANELSAPDLLRSAARLVERALIQLNMTTVTCPVCHDELAENFDHWKVYQQFTDLPGKLNTAAERIVNPNPARSRGYDEARAARVKEIR